MENDLDQLFRNKLANHKMNPTADAWTKLEQHLGNNRKKTILNRLAIAASFVVLFTIIGLATYQLSSHKSSHNPLVAEDIKPPTTERSEADNTENAAIAQSLATENIVRPESENTIALKHPTKAIENTEMDIMTKSPGEMEIVQSENPVELLENTDENPMIAQVVTEPELFNALPSDNTDIQTTIEKIVEPPQEALKVTVTYRANKNSKLIENQKEKGNILNEGIEKITGFAEERVFTDEFKTKLRNTTGDVLALNFGKIINKQGKNN